MNRTTTLVRRLTLATILTMILNVTLAVPGHVWADDAVASEPAIRAAEIHGGGDWQKRGVSKSAGRQWHLDLQRAPDGTLTGWVDLQGSPLGSGGTLHAKLDGTRLSGTITGNDGQTIAKVQGELTKQGFRGTYTDRTGEVGDWEWQGELPQ